MPLFTFLSEMNKGNFRYVDSMTDDEVTKVSPFVLTMWVGGATDETIPYRTITTANVCAPYIFKLGKHPRLLLKLFVAANRGIRINTRYKFRKSITKNLEKTIHLFARYYEVGYDDAKVFVDMATDERIEYIKRWGEDNEVDDAVTKN